MGFFDRWRPRKNPSGMVTLGARPTIKIRAGSGPTTPTGAGDPVDHPVLRRYATARRLDLPQNMLVAEECWVVTSAKRLLIFPPGAFAGATAQPAFRLERAGATLAWLEHEPAPGDPAVMLHITLASGRFILGDVHRSDEGDIDAFIGEFQPNVEPIDDGMARRILGTDR